MTPYETVYVLYPRGSRTGGPEALHQLVHTLRGVGQDAYLVPLAATAGAERVQEYAHYDAPERATIRDEPGCAVVASETAVRRLSMARQATRICWWLSVDNSPLFAAAREKTYMNDPGARARLLRTARAGRGLVYRTALRQPGWRGMVHLAQSHYAWNFVFDHLDVAPALVTDYTPVGHLDAFAKKPMRDRGLTVAYNPKKGGRLVEELIRAGAPHDFTPLSGMSRDEVFRTLCGSAVYLDAGHHPGKDRMPREAALAGAVTLVARRGSAANSRDVPIPWEHKIDMSGDAVRSARARLDDVFGALEDHKGRQSRYERFIRGEQGRFEREVEAFFRQGKVGSDLAGDSLAEPWSEEG